MRKRYQDKAAHAVDCRTRLPKHAHTLALLKVPGLAESLGTWVEQLVVQGERLSSLASARAQTATMSRIQRGKVRASTVRAQTLAIVSRLRATLKDELALDPDLLRTLEAELFTFIDQLAASRAASQRRRVVRST